MNQSPSVAATDDLPDLSSPYPLTAEQIESFRANGHVLLRGVCSPSEVAAYREVIVEASRNLNGEKRKLEERDTYGKAFLQTLNLRLHSEGVRKFVLSKRFGQIGAELMGVDGVRIFHEQSLFKEAGGGLTPWHQDQYYWPLEGLTTIGMWMPLVDCSEEMGVLKFASGTHRDGFLGQNKISDESQALYNELIQDRNIPIAATAMRAGDATFHYGWTLHGAGPNLTNTTREAMIVTMFADGMKVATPSNPSQENDRVKYLGGRAPGQLADSDLNTLLYRKC
jgi:ectoine hydroxylase-related dioxygenase (phytanoyl-CoA dioxygenase family)